MTHSRSAAVRRAGHKLADAGWAIPATIVFSVLLYVSLRIFMRDIETTMWGYQQFPTNKGGADISLYVALFFPLMQTACGYLAIALGFDDDKSNDKWAIFFTILTLLGFAFDAGMDIFFRVHMVLTPTVFAVAVFETFVIYTLGSEVMLSVCLAAVLVMLPYGIRDFFDLIKRLKTGSRVSSPLTGAPSMPQQRGRQKKSGKGGRSNLPFTTPKIPVGSKPVALKRDPGIGEIRQLEKLLDDIGDGPQP